jgi:DNA polymerase I-like protein with 3'-5' exonuclease and polymerase domains
LVTVIHDELVFDVAAEEFDWLVQRIPQWMDYPKISEVVPITVSMEYTQTNWSEKKGLHD